jgi:hypothetical protein
VAQYGEYIEPPQFGVTLVTWYISPSAFLEFCEVCGISVPGDLAKHFPETAPITSKSPGRSTEKEQRYRQHTLQMTGTYFPPGEVGPAMLLPNGRVFATGVTVSGTAGHTAIYTPGPTPADPGTFAVGLDFGAGDDPGDASAALLPSGHVLIAALSGRFYEYDGATLRVTGALQRRQYSLLRTASAQRTGAHHRRRNADLHRQRRRQSCLGAYD